MNRIATCLFLFFFLPLAITAQNAPPLIQNLTVSADWTAKILTVEYDLADADQDPLDVRFFLSNDGGRTYALTAQAPVSGDVGYPVLPGAGRKISCDLANVNAAGATFYVRLVADDRQPLDLLSLVNSVDSNQLRADLQFVEGIRHRISGTAHLKVVADSLSALFTQQRLVTQEQNFPFGVYNARNIIASSPGTVAADSVVIIDAHYDTVDNAPGADDNGSGTVAVMTLARLMSRYPAKKTLRFIGFDLEETGLTGSTRYVTNGIPAGEKINGVFNFEMIGYYSDKPNSQELPAGFNILFPAVYNQVAANQFRGDFITNVGHESHKFLANLFAASAATYVPGLKVLTVLEPVGIPVPDLRRSDHAPFWVANRPALMLSDGANFRNKCYHTAYDTLDNKLNFTFMTNVVQATLAAAAQLVGLQHGSWVAATFAGTTAAQELFAGCTVTPVAGEGQGIALQFGDCPPAGMTIEVFDAAGGLRYREQLDQVPANGTWRLQAPALPPGVYFLQLRAGGEHRTFKVALF